MADSFSTVGDEMIHHHSPPAFFTYRLDGDSPVLPASPGFTARIPVAGPYPRVTHALAHYLMASAFSFCGHLGYTLARVLGAPPLSSTRPGSHNASVMVVVILRTSKYTKANHYGLEKCV